MHPQLNPQHQHVPTDHATKPTHQTAPPSFWRSPSSRYAYTPIHTTQYTRTHTYTHTHLHPRFRLTHTHTQHDPIHTQGCPPVRGRLPVPAVVPLLLLLQHQPYHQAAANPSPSSPPPFRHTAAHGRALPFRVLLHCPPCRVSRGQQRPSSLQRQQEARGGTGGRGGGGGGGGGSGGRVADRTGGRNRR